jgi:hypothetical protein
LYGKIVLFLPRLVDSSSSSTAAAETPLVKMSASDLFVRKQPEEVGEETSPDPPALETSAEERYYLIDKKGIIVPFLFQYCGPNSNGPLDADLGSQKLRTSKELLPVLCLTGAAARVDKGYGLPPPPPHSFTSLPPSPSPSLSLSVVSEKVAELSCLERWMLSLEGCRLRLELESPSWRSIRNILLC